MSRSRQPGANSQLQTTTGSRDSTTARLTGTLRLRGDDSPHPAEPASVRRIRWSEDVVDNEGMGKKSSKGEYLTLCRAYRERIVTMPSVLYLPQVSAGGREQFGIRIL